MSEKIEPALTAEEWRRAAAHARSRDDGRWSMMFRDPVKAIALGNDILPDSDPRKITRARIGAVRQLIERAPESWVERHADEAARLLLDALESYLPPAAEDAI